MSFGGLNGYVPLNRIWFSGSCVTKFYYMIFIKRFSYVQNFKVHYPVLKRVYFWNGNLQHVVNVSIVWYQNSLYNGHCRDLEFVSSSARLCNRGSLFQSNAPSLLFFFSARISLRCLHDLNASLVIYLCLAGCYPYYRGVRYRGTSVRQELSVIR